MANEIKISVSLEFEKSGSSDSMAFSKLLRDMSGANFIHHRQIIGASEEVLLVGSDVGTGGYMLCVNRDTTITITLQLTTETGIVTLLAGDVALFRTTGAILATAASGTPELEYLMLDA